MSNHDSFISNRKFYAEEYFPYGLSRSGEFNRNQAQLLEKYGEAYQALHSGERKPVNDEEREFVAVCQGEKTPATQHEKVWILFCQKIQKQTYVSAFSGRPNHNNIDTASYSDEEW